MIERNAVLENIIKTKLADKNKNVGHNYIPDKNTFRLSSSTVCPRKAYYQKMYPSKVNDDLHRIFLIGQVFHELVQDTVFGDFQNEVEVKGSYGKINLIGHCDVLTDDAVVELKTCSYIPKEPYTHHILQVNAYAKLLGKDVVDIVYLQKNKLDVAVFRLQFDDELYNKLCETFHDAYDGIEQEILPYNVRSSECRFCNYRQLCMKGVR